MLASAKIIADSISPDGVRLTTIEGCFWRPVLAEVNTHRTLARNSASSRAIPFEKQVARIRADLAYPVEWATEQKGMQGGPPLTGDSEQIANAIWEDAAEEVIRFAERLRDIVGFDDEGNEMVEGQTVHKSIVNRLLEPFMSHTAVITATAWENFFLQRCSEKAQPEIRVFAEAARDAMANSTPNLLQANEWHLPYVSDDAEACNWAASHSTSVDDYHRLLGRISSARCAGTSYLTQGKENRDPERDAMTVYPKLVHREHGDTDSIHWSPLEHVATPWGQNRQDAATAPWFTPLGSSKMVQAPVGHLPKVGNLLGWRSLRTEEEVRMGLVTFR